MIFLASPTLTHSDSGLFFPQHSFPYLHRVSGCDICLFLFTFHAGLRPGHQTSVTTILCTHESLPEAVHKSSAFDPPTHPAPPPRLPLKLKTSIGLLLEGRVSKGNISHAGFGPHDCTFLILLVERICHFEGLVNPFTDVPVAIADLPSLLLRNKSFPRPGQMGPQGCST